MKSFEVHFLPYVLVNVPGCTTPLAIQALRSAAIEFCTRSNLIQSIAKTSSTAAVDEYDVEVLPQMKVARVLQVFYGTTELEIVPTLMVGTPQALRGTVDGAEPGKGSPRAAFFKTPSGSTFSVYPVPDESKTEVFTVRASFAPSRSASSVDDLLFDDWVEVIAAGAIGQLQAMPGQSFTSLSTAGAFFQQFSAGVARARIEASKGRVAGSMRVRPVSFA